MLHNGVPIEKVAKYMGHASINTTFKYFHMYFNAKKIALKNNPLRTV
jgi:site-specific recombinase XerD